MGPVIVNSLDARIVVAELERTLFSSGTAVLTSRPDGSPPFSAAPRPSRAFEPSPRLRAPRFTTPLNPPITCAVHERRGGLSVRSGVGQPGCGPVALQRCFIVGDC